MMKKKILTAISGMAMAGSSLLYGAAGKFDVKPAESQLTWTGKKVVGSTHTGTLDIKSGSIAYNEKGPESGEFVVDMTSIKNTDIKDPKDNAKLVGHLNSADFFDTANFKEATFKTSSVTAGPDGKFEAKGNLSVKGKTQPAVFTGTVKISGDTLTATGDMKFDRTAFDVRYGSGKFFENLGDKMISDEIAITVKLVAEKAKAGNQKS